MNRFLSNGNQDIISFGMPVSAANNWWGSDAGTSNVVEAYGGTVDYTPFLLADPEK